MVVLNANLGLKKFIKIIRIYDLNTRHMMPYGYVNQRVTS